MTKLPSSPLSTTTTLSQSYDSIIPSEEEESERHKFSNVARRGSRLSDIINLKERKKRPNIKRHRDKRGFVWRRWVPDGELLHQRAPQPHLSWQKPLANYSTQNKEGTQTPEETPSTSLQEISCSAQANARVLSDDPEIHPSTNILFRMDDKEASRSCSPSPSAQLGDLETTSNKSDNSFQTATSDPQINLLPAKITDSYSAQSSKSVKAPYVNKNGSVVNKKIF